jgi:two-component system response regulator
MENRTILLVEDNLKDELLTVRALNKCNFVNDIVVVRDGAEALDYLFAKGDYTDRNVDDLPKVVLLDLKLPKIDGLGVLRQIRANERTRLLPVVILTSSDEQKDIIAGYELGANSYVRKPVAFSEFSTAVAELGRYWLITNEPLRKDAGGSK